MGLDKHNLNINDTRTDYRADVIAANLIEDGYAPEKVEIQRNSAKRRGFAKEIDEASFSYSEEGKIIMKVNKEGIYDILPEGLFHRQGSRRVNTTREEMMRQIRVQRQQEIFARKFFQLFETELDAFLTTNKLYEMRFDKRTTHTVFISIFEPYWPVIKLLSREQALLFIHLIPKLHLIRNSHTEIREALELLLEVPIEIDHIREPVKGTGKTDGGILKSCRLGRDAILEGDFNDGLEDIRLTIGPVSRKKAEHLCLNTDGRKALKLLCELFFPANKHVRKRFLLNPEEQNCMLATNSQENFSHLGVTTYL